MLTLFHRNKHECVIEMSLLKSTCYVHKQNKPKIWPNSWNALNGICIRNNLCTHLKKRVFKPHIAELRLVWLRFICGWQGRRCQWWCCCRCCCCCCCCCRCVKSEILVIINFVFAFGDATLFWLLHINSYIDSAGLTIVAGIAVVVYVTAAFMTLLALSYLYCL